MKFLLFICVIGFYGCSFLKPLPNHGLNSLSQSNLAFDSLFTEALKEKLLCHYSESGDLLSKCLILEPKNAAVYYEMSIISNSQGRVRDALSAALSAVHFDRKNEWYLLNVSRIYQSLAITDSALLYYEKIIKVRPDKYDYGLKLSQLYYENKQYKKSLKVLNKLEHVNGITIDICFFRYRNYLGLGENRKCIQTLKSAIRRFPFETRFYGLMAEHYASLGDRELALMYYKNLLKIDPGNEKAYLSLIEFYYNSDNLVDALFLLHKFVVNVDFNLDSKVEILGSCLNEKSFNSFFGTGIKALMDTLCHNYFDNLNVHLLLSKFYIQANDLDKAQNELNICLTLDRRDEKVWENLVLISSYKTDFNGMLDISNDGLAIFPENPTLLLYKGIAFFQLHKYNDAINILSLGLKFTKESKDLLANYYAYLAECFNAIHDYTRSDVFFESSLGIYPDNPNVLNNYGYYLALRNEKIDRALIYMERCNSLRPNDFLILDTYAWVLFRAGKLNEAKRISEQALFFSGYRKPVILEHYCEILISLNMIKEAYKSYDRLVGLGYRNERIEKLLKQITN